VTLENAANFTFQTTSIFARPGRSLCYPFLLPMPDDQVPLSDSLDNVCSADNTHQLAFCITGTRLILRSLSAPRAQAAGVLTFLPRFQSSSTQRESWLLCGFALYFGPARSSTGMTHASGQALPLIRTLLDTLVCEPQARLRTFPGHDILGTRGDGVC